MEKDFELCKQMLWPIMQPPRRKPVRFHLRMLYKKVKCEGVTLTARSVFSNYPWCRVQTS